MMDDLHRWIGISIVGAFAAIWVYAAIARTFRRRQVGRAFWGLLYYSETVLVVQIVVGIVLLIMGHRIPTAGFQWLHYIYGSVFPLLAVIVGRLYSLRRGDADRPYEYVPIGYGAFVAFGLTARALMTGDPTIMGG